MANEDNVIKEEFTNNKFVCPFRTRTIITQMTQTIAEQNVLFPECQYGMCPFFDPKGKTISEKCTRIYTL